MSKHSVGGTRGTVTELEAAVTHVRDLLAPANPVPVADLAGAAEDDQGRATFHRIVTTSRTERAKARGRRWLTVAGITLALVGCGAAAAAGFLPDKVEAQFKFLGNNGYGSVGTPGGSKHQKNSVAVDKAQLRGQIRTPKGQVVELWTAPTKTGGDCFVVRQPSRGDKANGLSCAYLQSSTGEPAIVTQQSITKGETVVYGKVDPKLKDAAAIWHYSPDGRRHYAVPVKNGYFIGLTPAYAADWDTGKIEILDANRQVIAAIPGG